MQSQLLQCLRAPRAFAPSCPAGRAAPRRPQACAAGSGEEETPGLSRAQRRAVLTGLASVLVARGALAALATSGNTPRTGEVARSEEEWRAMLPPEAYRVLRQANTERPRSSPLLKEGRAGTFLCAGCSAALFSSAAKYDAGTGWPSFNAALPGATTELLDYSLPFEPRVEVRCKRCGGHLGHKFPDGPPPSNQRYCMNGVSLKFQPAQA